MNVLQILILSLIQGLAELLPVSSSAHVIVVAKLMGIDPSSPQFTLLLVMLHTGTMFAVIFYFWRRWHRVFFANRVRTAQALKTIVLATCVTGVIGLGMKVVIEHILKHEHPEAASAEVEDLFSNLALIAGALAAAGVLILFSGLPFLRRGRREAINLVDAIVIGAIQGLCLPFRGFSRSGATISTGLMMGLARMTAEDFSFALAVALTPAVVILEGKRLIHHTAQTTGASVGFHDFAPSLIGMIASFMGGLLALTILSKVLESGKWWVFGIYCLVASGIVFGLYHAGY